MKKSDVLAIMKNCTIKTVYRRKALIPRARVLCNFSGRGFFLLKK
jgi:hypothetical protein